MPRSRMLTALQIPLTNHIGRRRRSVMRVYPVLKVTARPTTRLELLSIWTLEQAALIESRQNLMALKVSEDADHNVRD